MIKRSCYFPGILIMVILACNPRLSVKKNDILHSQDRSTIGQDIALWDYIGKYKWRLIQWEGKLQQNSPIYLSFDVTELQFNGNAGCNFIFGSYNTQGDQLSFDKVASTEMACMNDSITTLEHQFITLLNESSFRFDVADQTLNLYKKDKTVLMFGKTDKEEK